MIKLKSLIVIFVSTLTIAVALVLTIFGISLYLNLEEKNLAKIHSGKIAELNASLYEKYISVTDLKAKAGGEGIYKGDCLVEGVVRNTGFRTVSSVGLDIIFLNRAREAMYTESLMPLGSSPPPSEKTIAALSVMTSGKELPLAPGQSFKFMHVLTEQKDKDLVSPIKTKKYATNPSEWSGKLEYKITSIKF